MFVALILPFTTFVHELGHSLVASRLLKVPVEIRLGKRFEGRGLTFGRLTLKIQPLSGWVGFFSYDVSSEKESRINNIFIFLAGPISSLILCSTCFVLIYYVNFPSIFDYLMKAVANAALAQFVITIIPIKYPSFFGAYNGISSDGYKVIKLFRQN
ncbi:M50 family metallopeptidase [Virgibacillus ndiopensis]|uniref:M50 family metallopeptidase n=1 Tax=Virgibacillus ndiopensis TaxID=2004408 RepID=UPI00159BE03C|nr:M50 family metallopeptidase [Virgibacillus ndiopensis]